jgi:thiol-disulfide isomerase/thioredoxin
MRRAAAIFLGGLAVAMVATACSGVHSGTAGSSGSAVGLTVFAAGGRTPLPDLSGTTLRGRRFALRALRGHVVVLNVWASWCSECRSESPLLARLSRSDATSGARFVGIDEQDEAGAARAFAARAGVRYPSISDPDGQVLARLSELPQTGIPSTLVIDPRGAAVARIIGAVHPDELRRALAVARADG